jgi:hypothetical protein
MQRDWEYVKHFGWQRAMEVFSVTLRFGQV